MTANTPPPLPAQSVATRKSELRVVYIVLGVFAILIVCAYAAFRSFIASGVTNVPDQMFGDQHLKTAVALIELHKLRYGKYPDKLQDLKFTGQWDQLAIASVGYYPSADRTAYFLEVQRGWIGKPDLQMPEEFWRGTGYSPSLRPEKQSR